MVDLVHRVDRDGIDRRGGHHPFPRVGGNGQLLIIT